MIEDNKYKTTVQCPECGCEFELEPWGEIMDVECECGTNIEVDVTPKIRRY